MKKSCLFFTLLDFISLTPVFPGQFFSLSRYLELIQYFTGHSAENILVGESGTRNTCLVSNANRR